MNPCSMAKRSGHRLSRFKFNHIPLPELMFNKYVAAKNIHPLENKRNDKEK